MRAYQEWSVPLHIHIRHRIRLPGIIDTCQDKLAGLYNGIVGTLGGLFQVIGITH
jgi:hypothetical protein